MTREQLTAELMVALIQRGRDPLEAKDMALAASARLNAGAAPDDIADELLRREGGAALYDTIRREVQGRDAARRDTPTAAQRLDAATPGASRIDAETPTTAAERLRALGG